MVSGGRPEAVFGACLRAVLSGSETVLDVGTSQRFAKELRPYESLFDGRQYVAAGYNPSQAFGRYNCDCHQDIEAMTFADGSFDAVLCLEVLEHVQDPLKAATEIQRVLRPGGKVFVSTPFLTGYHGRGGTSQAHDTYPDFWRFTHEGLLHLFRGLRERQVYALDGPLETRLHFLVPEWLLGARVIRWLVDTFDRPRSGRATTRHVLLGAK